jgi:hypothetical protein
MPTLEEELIILNKYKLTPNELLFVKTLLVLQDDDNEKFFGEYMQVLKNSNINLRDLILELQQKGVILKSYHCPKPGCEFIPAEIPLNKIFTKNLYKCSFELGKELFNTYPQFGNISGNVIPLRTVARKFDSLEDAYFKYSKAIGWNPETHQHIMELIEWGKDNNVINMSLASFIINRSWVDLETMKKGEAGNYDFNSIKLI